MIMEKKKNVLARGQITLTTISDGEGITISINGGVRGISYAADGTYPDPATSPPFSVDVIKNDNKITPYSYSWSCGGNVSGSSSEPTFIPEINPSYISGNSYVRVDIKENAFSSIYSQTIPIISTKFADGLDWIGDWNNNQTVVGENKLISPRIFAGEKGSKGLNGVALGVDALTGSKRVGLTGYKDNIPIFVLDTDGKLVINGNADIEGGVADILSGTKGGIYFDGENLNISGSVFIRGGNVPSFVLPSEVVNGAEDGTEAKDTTQKWSPDGTYIDGSMIATNSITANKIDLLSGLNVLGPDGKPVFSVGTVEGMPGSGTIEINGWLHSSNYIPGQSGYTINTDGSAELNNLVARGTLDVGDAGMTNVGDSLEAIRIWAGGTPDSAKFKVFRNGKVYATDVKLTGTLFGQLENNNLHIKDSALVINNEMSMMGENGETVVRSSKELLEVVRLSAERCLLNTNVIFGNNNLNYVKNSNLISINGLEVELNGLGSTRVIYKNGNKTDNSGVLFSSKSGASHLVRYSVEDDSFNNTLNFIALEGSGSNGYDFNFAKKYSGQTTEVKIDGNITVSESVKSSKQKIQMRSVKNDEWEGWGFYST